MSMRESIGLWILHRRIKKQTRNRQICNLDLANTVGIVFNATCQDSYDSATRFANFLTNNKQIKVYSIGYTNENKMLDFFQEKKGFKFFSRKHFNWFGSPKHDTIDFFINNEFDILLDLSITEYLPIKFIVGLSKAKLKVGRLIEGFDCYDVMIDVSKNNTLDYLIDQIELYLSILNVEPNKHNNE